MPWATQPEHSHLETPERMRTLLEGAGFRIELWEDPTEEMVELMRSIFSAPAPASAPVLTAGLFIDDLATKGPTYMANMAEGRTALLLAQCVAV